ncbi:BAAT / Acyl-CoA thioester hydrolase C terminal [Reichenbachiella faecimaris]|uniref:BAAT / Acyl-CoA thioester hydrolase C terminal n=1 Tax=Reichenbachiella faecimaris TaxID=692418 RepID=A0A1W2G871_REIFA|nr:acyl-CoA thioester hydrolase/BAAT C-terminal domain-containing protein [Reichenbachiella faecimaris]SMD32486.1 BAAT / Acyl-CoA thioester hydrolase C terminal [Reichenbachiella faecimaris]
MKTTCYILCPLILVLIFLFSYEPPIPKNYGKLDLDLYLPNIQAQALIVGFGGAEGGGSWTSDQWAATRQRFLDEGYAFLSIGYFGTETTSAELDRISLNAIHDSVQSVVSRNNIKNVALIGGSKGGELVLNLTSQHAEFSSAIALVPSHVSFPAHTPWMNTSSWSLNDKELTFVPASFTSLVPLLKGLLGEAFKVMLKDKKTVKSALIPVEKIEGSILLLSAENDEQWPSTYMCAQIMNRLNDNAFQFEYEHIIVPGDHSAPLQRFDVIFKFLNQQFKSGPTHTSVSSLD